MNITQIYDNPLAQAGYVISDSGFAAVIDPGRHTAKYKTQIEADGTKLVAAILTHPHADFVSGHQELAGELDVPIYVSEMFAPVYEFTPFDTGDRIEVGKVTLRALNTPGHSPDSISIVVSDADGKDIAVFTGDTLFVGDVGRPDLRESAGAQVAAREELAKSMFASTRDVLMKLDDDVVMYPAHGAGTLCGKNLSDERSSTIGKEKRTNPALQPMTESEFVDYIIKDQPFVPHYFGYDVELNRQAMLPPVSETMERVSELQDVPSGVAIIDVRDKALYKQGYVTGSINIPAGVDDKFETWVGSIFEPNERFVLAASSQQQMQDSYNRLAKIGYEVFVDGYIIVDEQQTLVAEQQLDIEQFKSNKDEYTIVDVRNTTEDGPSYFADALTIPLPELRKRYKEIPTAKPVVVHCAGGYRSAVGSSVLRPYLPNTKVYDIGEAIESVN